MEAGQQVTAEPSGALADTGTATGTQEERKEPKDGSWEYRLRKYLLLLATLVATVTYGAAFNPPGGVWQDANPDTGVIAGDPIIRETSYRRYLIFFYSNATAFACSLVVIVLILILAVLHERHKTKLDGPLRILRFVMVLDLLSLMGAYAAGTFRDRLTAIYSCILLAGVVLYLAIHMALALQDYSNRKASGAGSNQAPESKPEKDDDSPLAKLRKVLMLLAIFAVSVTYVAGLSAPGGFWDHEEDGHQPGRAILKGGAHDKRLKAFFVFNTTAFVASLIIIIILMDKKLYFTGDNFKSFELYGFIAVTLIGLVGAYSAGSCRHIDTTIYINSLVGAVIAFILLQAAFKGAIVKFCKRAMKWKLLDCISVKVSGCLKATKEFCWRKNDTADTSTSDGNGSSDEQKKAESRRLKEKQSQALQQAHSLVLLLATLAAAITYQAGLNPPGGLWQDDDTTGGRRYMAGDPILLTTNPRQYKAFYYCNSVAFVASLVAIVLVRMKTLHHHNALEAAMILDLLGLIGAYAAGSCRDVTTSIYAMGLAGAVLVYVVIHVVMFTLDPMDDIASQASNQEEMKAKMKAEIEIVEKRRKRLLLFAILAATITYQAGLTPPGGFLQKDDRSGHHAGDPVLLYNYPRRYKAFFYCNSVSYMLSIALIIILVNPNMYRPAIRTHALSVCTAVGLMGIMGAYAAGCTQHLKTSIYIFALAAFVLIVVLVVVVYLAKKKKKAGPGGTAAGIGSTMGSSATRGASEDLEAGKGAQKPEDRFCVRLGKVFGSILENLFRSSEEEEPQPPNKEEEKKLHAKRKYLMLLGILVASITYQAGLAPPGGSWQSNLGGHAAGDPVMHDNRRIRYLAFFYSNSTSFVASVVVIFLLLRPLKISKKGRSLWLGVMNTTIVLDLLGLLIAYAAGSSRSWKTAGYVTALVIAVLAYFVVHVLVSCFMRMMDHKDSTAAEQTQSEGTNGHGPDVQLTQPTQQMQNEGTNGHAPAVQLT